MYVRLAKRCKLIYLNGINMVGCPLSHVIFGLTEEGFEFVRSVKEGRDVNVDSLSEDIKQLFEAMIEKGFFQDDMPEVGNKSAYLHITSRCNMNCVGCYSNSGCNQETVVNEMSVKQIFHIVDNLTESGFNSIVVSGGEPFLYNEINEIFRYMKSKGCNVACITNGTASEATYISSLKYIDTLSFSMDGLDEKTSVLRYNTAKKIDGLIKILRGRETVIRIIFTLHKKNYHLYQEMQTYAKSLGVPYNFSLFTAEKNNRNDEYLLGDEELIELSEQFDSGTDIMDSSFNPVLSCSTCCGAGKTLVSISATGDIYPCHMMHQREFLMGNALKDKISCVAGKISPYGYFPVYKKTDCKDCEYAYLCGGGCLYRAYALSGNLESKEQLCSLYKQQIDRILAPFTK